MPAVERGLEVLALVLLVVVRLREGSVEMVATTRGRELPVVLRVEAIVGVCLRYRKDVSGLLSEFGSELGRIK